MYKKPEYSSRRAIANALDISTKTVDRLIKAGEIKAIKMGCLVRISTESVTQYQIRCHNLLMEKIAAHNTAAKRVTLLDEKLEESTLEKTPENKTLVKMSQGLVEEKKLSVSKARLHAEIYASIVTGSVTPELIAIITTADQATSDAISKMTNIAIATAKPPTIDEVAALYEKGGEAVDEPQKA